MNILQWLAGHGWPLHYDRPEQGSEVIKVFLCLDVCSSFLLPLQLVVLSQGSVEVLQDRGLRPGRADWLAGDVRTVPGPCLRSVESGEDPPGPPVPPVQGRGGAGGLTDTAGQVGPALSEDRERSGERSVASPHKHLQSLRLHPLLRHELHPLVERLHALQVRDVSDGGDLGDWTGDHLVQHGEEARHGVGVRGG